MKSKNVCSLQYRLLEVSMDLGAPSFVNTMGFTLEML